MRRGPGERLPIHQGGEAGQSQRQAGVRALRVSRAAYYAARNGRPSDATARTRSWSPGSQRSTSGPGVGTGAAYPRRAAPLGPLPFSQADRLADASGGPDETVRNAGGRSPSRTRPPRLGSMRYAGTSRRRRQGQPAVVRRLHLPGDMGRLALPIATVIGITSRRVVRFALTDHLRTELVADALANAVAARDPAPRGGPPLRLCRGWR